MIKGDFHPVGEVLPGVEFVPLKDGHTPLEAVAVIKVLDEDGDIAYSIRWSPGVNVIDRIGMLQLAASDAINDGIHIINGGD